MTRLRTAIRVRHFSVRTEESLRRLGAALHRISRDEAPGSDGGVGDPGLLSVVGCGQEGRRVHAESGIGCATVLIYRHVLGRSVETIAVGMRAKRPERLPVVLTREEVRRVLATLAGTPALVANLLYGAGLRLLEALNLRVKDIDFERGEIRVRDGKGRKDRVTMLPAILLEPLREHLRRVRDVHKMSIIRMWPRAQAGSFCRTRCRRSTRMRIGSGHGNGCFPHPRDIWIEKPASSGAITFTKLSSSEP
jgi:hypothetical protein